MAIYYTKVYIELSVQEILDCSKNGATYGCFGGYMEGVYAYVIKHGISSAYTYPY